jgi:hypothetical protein
MVPKVAVGDDVRPFLLKRSSIDEEVARSVEGGEEAVEVDILEGILCRIVESVRQTPRRVRERTRADIKVSSPL